MNKARTYIVIVATAFNLLFSCKPKVQPIIPKAITEIPEDTIPLPPPRDFYWWVNLDTFTFSKEAYEHGDFTLNYRLLLPPGLPKEGRKYPLALVLHGSNLRGDDNERQIENNLVQVWHGGESLMQKTPTIIVVPQCPSGMYWTDDEIYESIISLLNDVSIQYPVDPDSLYLSGFSIGGTGVYKLLSLQPYRWAASCAISSFTTASTADPNSFYFAPLRIIIAKDDPIINYSQAEVYFQQIWDAKGNPGTPNDTLDPDLQIKVFPDSIGLGHNIIDTVTSTLDYLDFFYTRGK